MPDWSKMVDWKLPLEASSTMSPSMVLLNEFEQATNMHMIVQLFDAFLYPNPNSRAKRRTLYRCPIISAACINTSTGALLIGLVHLLKIESPIEHVAVRVDRGMERDDQWYMIQKGDSCLEFCTLGHIPHANTLLNRSSQVHIFLLPENDKGPKCPLILLLEEVDEVFRLLSCEEFGDVIIACGMLPQIPYIGPIMSADEARRIRREIDWGLRDPPDATAIASWSLWTLLTSTINMLCQDVAMWSRDFFKPDSDILRGLFPETRQTYQSAKGPQPVTIREIVPLLRGWVTGDPQEGSSWFREKYPSLLANRFSHICPTVKENQIQFTITKEQ